MGAPSFTSPVVALGPIIGARFAGAPRLPGVVGASDITADLMDPDDPAIVGEPLLGTYARSWVETLSDAGSGSITFGNDDPTLPDVVEGSLIRFSLKGQPAVTMGCEVVDALLIGGGDNDDEQAALETTWTGRLHGAVTTEHAVLYPSRGIRTLPVQENMSFDYTLPEYDDTGMGRPAVLTNVETARDLLWYVSPLVRFIAATPDDIGRDFPDPFAALLWAPGATLLRGRPLPADAGGDGWGRRQITFPSDGTYRGFGFCDDSMSATLDGVTWWTIAGGGYGNTGSGDIEATAGVHTLAFHGHNLTDAQIAWSENPGGVFNPGFVAYSIFRSDAINTDGFIAHSDGTEKFVGYTTIPGMTPGRAWRLFSDKAEARGVAMPARGFTDLVDSAGKPWPFLDLSTRVGNDGFSILREWSVSAIDWKMRVGSFTLDMWNLGGAGVSRSVALHGPTDPDDETSSTLTRLERKGQQT